MTNTQEKIKVALAQASDYGKSQIDEAVSSLFEQLGGIENLIKKGSAVFVKVNLVREMKPEKCGTTHPAVVQSICSYLKEKCGAVVTVGDSSGGPYTKAFMENCYRVTQMKDACEQSGALLNDDYGYSLQEINGLVLKQTEIVSAFLKADAVINIGKLKTHGFTGYTGCVKNLYGLIPGLVKSEIHGKFSNLYQFTDCIIDLERYASKRVNLHVLDAVTGMEGKGPTNGQPRFMGFLIASKNAYAADIAGVSLFDDPFSMPIIKRAAQREIIKSDLTDIDCNFSLIEENFINDFDKVKVVYKDFLVMPLWLASFIKKLATQKAVIGKEKCKKCGRCIAHCPQKTIVKDKKGRAKIVQSNCIRCYCCQELCPFDAVNLKKPLVNSLMRRGQKKQR